MANPAIVSGQAIGSTITVADSTELATTNTQGVTVGSKSWNADVGSYFTLTVSSAALVPDSVVEVYQIDGLRWIKDTTDIPAGSITLADMANLTAKTFIGRHTNSTGVPEAVTATQLTSDLNLATNSLQGMMAATEHVALGKIAPIYFAQGSPLPDNDVTVQPFTDHASLYVLSGPITTNRAVTLGNTSAANTALVMVLVLDTSSHIYTIKNAAGGALYNHPANGVPMLYQMYCNGSDWATNTTYFVQA